MFSEPDLLVVKDVACARAAARALSASKQVANRAGVGGVGEGLRSGTAVLLPIADHDKGG